jgi:hypothetical protein
MVERDEISISAMMSCRLQSLTGTSYLRTVTSLEPIGDQAAHFIA